MGLEIGEPFRGDPTVVENDFFSFLVKITYLE